MKDVDFTTIIWKRFWGKVKARLELSTSIQIFSLVCLAIGKKKPA